MKKQLLLLFATLAISSGAYAEHVYLTFVVVGKVWNCTNGNNIYSYTIEEDAIIHNENYKSLQ